MKEYLSYNMMSGIGINTPAYSYSNITLNGKEWELYLTVELMEEDFLTQYYGTNYGNLYKPESTQMGGEQDEKGKQPNGRKAPQDGKPQGVKPECEIPQGDKPQGKMANMEGGNLSTSLVYTDDSLSSYSGIFDDIITESTTNTDKKKVVEMIKNLSNGTNLAKHLDIYEILRYFAVNTFLFKLSSFWNDGLFLVTCLICLFNPLMIFVVYTIFLISVEFAKKLKLFTSYIANSLHKKNKFYPIFL